MIENVIPKKFNIEALVAGYTKVYLRHGTYIDEDIQGKAYWVTQGATETRQVDGNLERYYSVLTGLTPNTSYSIKGTYYDSMVDDQLLKAKVGVLLSNASATTTKQFPSFVSHSVTSEQVDVGVGTPSIHFTLGGSGDSVIIEAQVSGTSTWAVIYNGGMSTKIDIPLNPATYNFRLSGRIFLPDGVTVESSTPVVLNNIVVTYKFTPPSAPVS